MYALIAIVLLVAGCATTSPPVQEMSDARQAVQAARAHIGGGPSAAQLRAAETLLDQASEALAEGRYDEARRAAVAAKEKAIRARETAALSGTTEQ